MDELKIVAGLDVGTTKVTACIGTIDESGNVTIVGVGTAKSEGIKNGVVVNIESIKQSIKYAIDQAELMSGVVIEELFLGISGPHIKHINSRGTIAITNRNHSVGDDEVNRVIEAARAVVIPSDYHIIHVLSREFFVDDQNAVKYPIGMTGIRLEAEVHIVSGQISAIQNLYKAVSSQGYEVADIIFSPLAASEVVLSNDEKELGVALIDVGGGISDMLVYIDGGVSFSGAIPIAGNFVTSDIALGLKTPLPAAEDIKLKYGCATPHLVDAAEYIQVPSVGGRPERRLNRQELCQIIEPRMEEIFEHIDEKFLEYGKKTYLSAGAVITGGSVNLEGSVEIAERVLNIPVRIGYPQGVQLLKDFMRDPAYTTAIGLVAYGARQRKWHVQERSTGSMMGKFFQKMRRLFFE